MWTFSNNKHSLFGTSVETLLSLWGVWFLSAEEGAACLRLLTLVPTIHPPRSHQPPPCRTAVCSANTPGPRGRCVARETKTTTRCTHQPTVSSWPLNESDSPLRFCFFSKSNNKREVKVGVRVYLKSGGVSWQGHPPNITTGAVFSSLPYQRDSQKMGTPQPLPSLWPHSTCEVLTALAEIWAGGRCPFTCMAFSPFTLDPPSLVSTFHWNRG